MKLLIAHDESTYSDAAISDLARAGLPEETEAIILSVVEQKLVSSPPGSLALFGVSAATAPAMLPDYERHLVEAARKEALAVVEVIKSRFPSWKVTHEVTHGSPVTQILDTAKEWKPKLIVVGSHDRSALGRLFLGSVSHDVVKHADCSVRVGRKPAVESDSRVKLVIGVDGSPGSEAAVKAVAGRRWPAGSEARVLAALNLMATATPRGYLAQIAEKSEALLRSAGLNCTAKVRVGESSHILTNEAKEWGADCIFLGARGLSTLERLLLGSTSAAVAANASCSVEVVRSAESSQYTTLL